MKKIALLIGVFLVPGMSFALPPPPQADAIPPYPHEVQDTFAQGHNTQTARPGEISRTALFYQAGADIDQVFSFYQGKLGDPGKGPQPTGLPTVPGSYSPVRVSFQYYDEGDFRDGIDPMGKKTYEGNWIRQTLKDRRRASDGRFLKEVDFSWVCLDQGSQSHVIQLRLTDTSFDGYRGSQDPQAGVRGQQIYRETTQIFINEVVYPSRSGTSDQRNRQQQEGNNAGEVKGAQEPPSEKALGVPPYPGSRFLPQESAGMTMGNSTQAWIFASDEGIETIVAFYEKATGKKAEATPRGQRIVLKGSGLIPDHFLAVQPNNAFPGKGKNLIEVFKKQ